MQLSCEASPPCGVQRPTNRAASARTARIAAASGVCGLLCAGGARAPPSARVAFAASRARGSAALRSPPHQGVGGDADEALRAAHGGLELGQA
eukprot:477707-Pleurochrysis_carterae.AAC.4